MKSRFPASHRFSLGHSFDIEVARRRASESASSLGWKPMAGEGAGCSFRVPMSWRSWGEVVTFEVEPGRVSFESRCRLATQVADFGKNEHNALAFAERFYHLEG